MDYKLDYMTRLFAKISKKKTETYVISRIWHQLNDDRVKFVVQQYIKRSQNKYALADLYLPQLGIFIEINEPFHKNNIEIDQIRNEEISQATRSNPIVIDCGNIIDKDKIHWASIESIHSQISDVVQQIKQTIIDKGDGFIPWNGESSFSVEYHRKKGYLKVDDSEYIRTIDEAFAIFGAKAKHRGFLRVAGASVPQKENEIVWCPNSMHHIWCNELSEDGLIIREYKRNEQARREHVARHLTTDQRRVTFFREEDELGFNLYRFVGVFELNKDKSEEEKKCVWERTSDIYMLNI